MIISCNTFYGGARAVILYNLSSAKCSNTAYGAKPSRTSNIKQNNKVMIYKEYIKAIASFEDFKSRANKCDDNNFRSKLMEAYDKGLHEVGRKILIENNITPNKIIDIACTPISFEPISARIDKNNEVILIGYSRQDRTDYKVRKEYKLNNLFYNK